MNFIRLKVEPIGKPRMTRGDAWKKRKCVLEYWAFKDHVNYTKRGFQLGDRFTALFCVPFPKTYSKKKCKELFLKAHQEKPDLDNMLKAVLDALKPEDKRASDIRARKVWSYKPAIFLINR